MFTKGNGWKLHPFHFITVEFPVTDHAFGASKRNNPSEAGNPSVMGGSRENPSSAAPEQLEDVRA